MIISLTFTSSIITSILSKQLLATLIVSHTIYGVIFMLSLILNIVLFIRYKNKKNSIPPASKTDAQLDAEMIAFFIDDRKHKDISLESFKKERGYKGSMLYAKHIQNAMFPPISKVNSIFSDNFILYRPKSIISGDYYWVSEFHDKAFVAVADCTGHGVPGAMMSMLGIAFLNEITHDYVSQKNKAKISANNILNELNVKIQKTLHQTGKIGEAKDGIDIALCIIDKKKLILEYSGAYSPIYIFRKNKDPKKITEQIGAEENIVVRDKAKRIEINKDREFILVNPDKLPIGIHYESGMFTNKIINLQKGDMIYMFSDGFTDQFGGSKERKFSSRKFKMLLSEIYTKPLGKQKEILDRTIDTWKGELEQLDDILVMGIKVSDDTNRAYALRYDWSNKTFLLAEDDEIIYRYIKEILSDTKVNLLWARNGKVALEVLEKNRNIDLLLADIHMPVLNGYELIKEAKEKYRHLKIIVQAAYKMSNEKEKSFAAGCDDYVAKPINPKEFLSKIEKYI